MYRLCGLVLKCNLRTPVMASMAIFGANYCLHQSRRHSGPVFGLRHVHLSSQDNASKPLVPTIGYNCKKSFQSVVGLKPIVKGTDTSATDSMPSSSGFIIKDSTHELNGYIITTARAVGNSKEVRVGYRGTGSDCTCKVVYLERHLDLALIAPIPQDVMNAIDKEIGDEWSDGLVGIELGDSDALAVDDPVVSVTSHWGFNTVSTGVISCPKRLAKDIPKISEQLDPNTHFIQHSALYPTDSCGGALLNTSGWVVGIYCNLRPNSQSNMFYAIPSNVVKGFMTRGQQYLNLLSTLEKNPKFLNQFINKHNK